MKKSFITIFTLLLSCMGFAQNWSPINLTEKFNYQNDTAVHITNTLYVDSFHVEGLDSIFYLNRIVLPCDTCQGNSQYYFLANQGQFLQKEIRKEVGNKFLFSGNNAFTLFPNAQLNESWLMDTLNNIEATISNIQTFQLFNNQDSVKTISLSTGDSILLSKNYGLVYFPELYGEDAFSLVGIHGRDLGALVSGFWEIYDFQVGDILQYEGSYSKEAWDKTDYHRKIEITEKEITGNIITYQIITSSCTSNWTGWSNCSSNIPQSMIFTESNDDFAKSFNHELYTLPNSNYYYAVVQLKIDDEGDLYKSHEVPGQLWFENILRFASDTSDILLSANFVHYQNEAKTALGNTLYNVSPFESHDYRELIGYIKNDDTTGIIYPDSSYIVSTSQKFQEKFSLYPNPTDDKINLNFNQNLPETITIHLYNALGHLVVEKTVDKGNTTAVLELTAFSKGVYYLVINSETIYFTEKVILR